jgi:hypothetical protein
MSVLLLDGDARNYATARYFTLIVMIILFITEQLYARRIINLFATMYYFFTLIPIVVL